MSSDIFKCNECGGKVSFTGRKQKIMRYGQTIDEGLVLLCSKCKTPYFALQGQWFKDIITPIEPLNLFNDNE